MKAIDRACLQYATQVVVGRDAFYVASDVRLLDGERLTALDPSDSVLDAVIALLASTMKLHLLGCTAGQLFNDLLRAGVGEQLAERVHDHVGDVSDPEWAALRARIRWYADEHKQALDSTQPMTEVTDGGQ
ncbi:hypothetical protein [Vannielia sp. SX4]|uniref:hypothetical protein n=1 Tax=Vannielia sp. SX4 TaxID=3463852 RepID=UPI0040590F0C